MTAGVHPEGAAAARDETAATLSSILLTVGRKLRRSLKPESTSTPQRLIQGNPLTVNV